MKKRVAIILLAYGRDELTEKVLKHNLDNCGVEEKDYDVFRINQQGIALALNRGIIEAQAKNDYEYFMFLANDIWEPEDWLLKRLFFMTLIANGGVASVAIDHIPTVIEIGDVIGNWLIKKEVIEKIGYFNEELGEYGPIDLDYNWRVRLSDYSCFYVPGIQAKHNGVDDTIYGYSKKERVDAIWNQHVKDARNYASGGKSLYYKSKLLK